MLENLNTLEERIEKPGYLLFVVVTLLLLIISFVNVISFEGYGDPILGKFSIIHIVALIGMGVLLLGWASLLWRPNDDRWLQWVLDRVANRPVFLLGLTAAYIVALWHMFTATTWLNLPALWTALLLFMIIFGAMVLLHNWDGPPKPGLLRRGLVYFVATFVVVELLAQLLALAGLLPSITTTLTTMAPFDRIYFVGPDVTVDTMANRYGYHAADFRLAEGEHRIALIGDQVVRALEVPADESLGGLLNQALPNFNIHKNNVEVLPLGFPDYGAAVYLYVNLWYLYEDAFAPDEIIIFLDFNNDFQIVNASDEFYPYFYRDGDEAIISDYDWYVRHDRAHEALWGLDGYQPRRLLRSHILSVALLRNFLAPEPVVASNRIPAPQEDIPLPNSFVFYEESNDEVMFILLEQLREFVVNAQEKGTKVTLVTVPVFPDAFYAQAEAIDWTTQFGAADLFLPERELSAFAAANGVRFVGMGEYMREAGLSAADIQALYYPAADGGLTPAGHKFFADAVINCFYGDFVVINSGCAWNE
ncbi:MAG: hypothetical protein KDE34_08165 [Anaerolineales bacterium]|nr:hypothetical protein [Anaerolineales bacterium]